MVLTGCASALGYLAFSNALQPIPILAVLLVIGGARSFVNPTIKALLVNVVDRTNLPRAIALNASLTKIAVISGPVVGGVLYTISAALAFSFAAAAFVVAGILLLWLRGSSQEKATTPLKGKDLLGGFAVILRDRVLFGAIFLDLAVVFIGGAIALLPVYAKDILHTDAVGLGILRSGPALGAFLVGALLAWRPIRRMAGKVMILCVAGYGLAILLFGISELFWVSFLALVASGCFDVVSVNVRESLVQLRTPDHLRGRVTSVNGVFVAASNELGDFRAGAVASLFGAVPAVVFGGCAAVAVASAWYSLFPSVRRVDKLT